MRYINKGTCLSNNKYSQATGFVCGNVYKIKRCQSCGKMIEIKNKKDFSTKYCNECAYKIKLKQVNECKKRKKE